jgi:hypothetical protein
LSLQRLVLTFKAEGVEVRALYRKKNGPNPGTKARARKVVNLTKSGLQNALRTLEGRVEVIDKSGYEIREETISVDVVRK